MPELKCEKTQVIKVEYGDLENFIEEVYGHKHCVVSSEECGNDTTLAFNGIGKYPEDIDEEDREDFKEWEETGKHMFMGTRQLLEELCLAEHIESGDYLVEIYW